MPGKLFTNLRKLSEKSLSQVIEIQVQVRIQWGLTDVKELNVKVPIPFYILFSISYIQHPILDPIQVNIIMHIQISYSNIILEVKTGF